MEPHSKNPAFVDSMSEQHKCSSSMIVSFNQDDVQTKTSNLNTNVHGSPFHSMTKLKGPNQGSCHFNESYSNSRTLDRSRHSYRFKEQYNHDPTACLIECATTPIVQKDFRQVFSHWEIIKKVVTRKLSHRGRLSKAVLHIWDAGTRYFWGENIKLAKSRCRSLPCLSKYRRNIRNKELGYLRRLIYQFLIHFKSFSIRKTAENKLLKFNEKCLPTMFSCFDQTLQLCWNTREKDLKMVDGPLSLDDKTYETKCVSAFYFLKCDFVLQILVKKIMPSPQERHLKYSTIDAITSLIQNWKHDIVGVHVVGSTAYDVDCTASDLDVVLITSETDYLKLLQHVGKVIIAKQEQFSRETCLALKWGIPHESLYYDKWPLRYVTIQVVENARVPILLLKYPQGVVCDISVNTRNSLSHTHFFKTILKNKPHLRALMRLVKYWIKVRRMPVMRDGGLPNIVWMILCVIACRHSEICYSSLAYSLIHGKEDQAKMCSVSEWEDKKKTLQAFTSQFTQWLWNLDLSFLQSNFFSSHTILLSEFFSRFATRKNLTSTISIASGTCIPKDAKDVAQRILSPWYRGVWDELLSVEDPANFNNQFFPEAFFCSPRTMLSRTLHAPNVSSNGIPTPLFQDLVSKTSSATWLVYQYELRRADVLMRTLTQHFSCFQEQLASQPAYNLLAFLKEHLKHLIDIFVNLFAENDEHRYRVPALLPDKLKRFSQSSPVLMTSTSLDASLNRNGDQPQAPSFHLALVLLNGKLMLLHLVKICPDRNGWWSNEFLTRRDTRSVLHGEPMYVVSLGQNKQKNRQSFTSCFYNTCGTDKKTNDFFSHQWLLCNSPLYLTLLDTKKNLESFQEPFFNKQESTPIILFNPSNLVCFLQMIPISLKPNNKIPVPYKLYALPEEETERVILFYIFAKQAPYWHTNFSNVTNTNLTKPCEMDLTDAVQPTVRSCKLCGTEGTTMVSFDLGLPHQPFRLENSHSSTCPSHNTTDSNVNAPLNDSETPSDLLLNCPALQVLKKYFSLNEAYNLFEKTNDAPDEKFLQSHIVQLLTNVTEKFDTIFSRFFTALILNDSNGVVINDGRSEKPLKNSLTERTASKQKQAPFIDTEGLIEKQETTCCIQQNSIPYKHSTTKQMVPTNMNLQNNNTVKETTCVLSHSSKLAFGSNGSNQSTHQGHPISCTAPDIHSGLVREKKAFTLQNWSKFPFKKSQTFTPETCVMKKQSLKANGLPMDKKWNTTLADTCNHQKSHLLALSKSTFSKPQHLKLSSSSSYMSNSCKPQIASQTEPVQDLQDKRSSRQFSSNLNFQSKTLFPCVNMPPLSPENVLPKASENNPCQMVQIQKNSVHSIHGPFNKKLASRNALKNRTITIPSRYPLANSPKDQTPLASFHSQNVSWRKENLKENGLINPHSMRKCSFPYEKPFCRTHNLSSVHCKKDKTTMTEDSQYLVHALKEDKIRPNFLLTSKANIKEKCFYSGNPFLKKRHHAFNKILQVSLGSRESNSDLPHVKKTECHSIQQVVKTSIDTLQYSVRVDYSSRKDLKKKNLTTVPSDPSKGSIKSTAVSKPHRDTTLPSTTLKRGKRMSHHAWQKPVSPKSPSQASCSVKDLTVNSFNVSKSANVVSPSFPLYEKKKN